MTNSADSCVVALLGRDDNARQQLRQALEDLGASVAYESDIPSATGDTVFGVSPTVVIVNLEEHSDDDLDHLQDILDAPDINVIFNDADVSTSLEGWDLARWARHLAAKVLGHNDTMPPRPEGAQPLVTNSAGPSDAEARDAPPNETGNRFDMSAQAGDGAADASTDHAGFESLSFDEELPDPAGGIAVEGGASAPDVDFSSFGLDDDETASDVAGDGDVQTPDSSEDEKSTPAPAAIDLDDFGDLSGLDLADISVGRTGEDAAAEDSTAAGDSSLEDFSWDDPAKEETAESAADKTDSAAWSADDIGLSDGDGEDLSLDDDVAALAAQLDALAASTGEDDAVKDLDFGTSSNDGSENNSDDGLMSSDSEADDSGNKTEDNAGKSGSSAFSGLSLSLVDDDAGAETDAAAEPQKEKPAFNFDKLDHLSLEPVDDAGEEQEEDPLLAALGLTEAPSLEQFNQEHPDAGAEIEHVIVLGASIGGPDALRSFLGELPKSLKAVVLLVQHLESGYFERLAQQLQKFSALPVKVAESGQTAALGEVLVIPASEKVVMETDGRIVTSPHEVPPRYTPSIDDVLHAVADRFGARATAIVFSGMGGDAIEGAAYLSAKGGEVWAQEPSTCVVSSMVDGAQARGVVGFTGSPQELAQQCAAKFMR